MDIGKMTRREAIKNINKTNKLRRSIEKLSDRLWREPINGKGFKLCQDRLSSAIQELEDGSHDHRLALKVFIG